MNDTGDNFLCDCPPGFGGVHCETVLDGETETPTYPNPKSLVNPTLVKTEGHAPKSARGIPVSAWMALLVVSAMRWLIVVSLLLHRMPPPLLGARPTGVRCIINALMGMFLQVLRARRWFVKPMGNGAERFQPVVLSSVVHRLRLMVEVCPTLRRAIIAL